MWFMKWPSLCSQDWCCWDCYHWDPCYYKVLLRLWLSRLLLRLLLSLLLSKLLLPILASQPLLLSVVRKFNQNLVRTLMQLRKKRTFFIFSPFYDDCLKKILLSDIIWITSKANFFSFLLTVEIAICLEIVVLLSC